MNNNHQKKMEECYICTDMLQDSDVNVLNCGHKFHKYCLMMEYIQQIKMNTKEICCPYCREKQSHLELKSYLEKIKIRNFPSMYEIVPKFSKISVNTDNYDKSYCCVYNLNLSRQCKRIVKENLLSLANEFEMDKFEEYNDFEIIKKGLCTYHTNNFSKVNFMVHPIYKYNIRVFGLKSIK